jgi:type IV secretory pathway VirB2 component (pilin)
MRALIGQVTGQAKHVAASLTKPTTTSIKSGQIARRSTAALRAAASLAAMLTLAIAAHAQTGSLDTITSVGDTFATWLRAFAGILGVIAIVWGGINMYFSDLGRGMSKVVAVIVGLIIAGYAQSIVNTFFTTSS